MMMMRKLVILMSGLITLFGACQRSKVPREVKNVTVKTDTVEAHEGELSIVYPGKVYAASDISLSFRVAGPIIAVLPEDGAFVKKGQLLAEIDPRDYKIQLAATEAEYKQIKGEAERVMELYKRGSIAINDYEKAVYGLKQITAKYEAHKNALRDTRLLAPFDGYVQKRFYDAHETVAAGYPVISMINSNYFDVEIDIPTSDYVRQKQFKSFYCTFDVFPGKVFPLELVEVTRKANLNQLYHMKLRLKAVDDVDIAAGMSVNVTIEYVPLVSQLVAIPLSAVFDKNGSSVVWVYNPTSATVSLREVDVKQLLKSGDAIIQAGLQAGEIVVSAGVHSLEEGMKVEVLKGVSKTNVGGLL